MLHSLQSHTIKLLSITTLVLTCACSPVSPSISKFAGASSTEENAPTTTRVSEEEIAVIEASSFGPQTTVFRSRSPLARLASNLTLNDDSILSLNRDQIHDLLRDGNLDVAHTISEDEQNPRELLENSVEFTVSLNLPRSEIAAARLPENLFRIRWDQDDKVENSGHWHIQLFLEPSNDPIADLHHFDEVTHFLSNSVTQFKIDLRSN